MLFTVVVDGRDFAYSPNTLIILKFLGNSLWYPMFASAASAFGSVVEPRRPILPVMELLRLFIILTIFLLTNFQLLRIATGFRRLAKMLHCVRSRQIFVIRCGREGRGVTTTKTYS